MMLVCRHLDRLLRRVTIGRVVEFRKPKPCLERIQFALKQYSYAYWQQHRVGTITQPRSYKS